MAGNRGLVSARGVTVARFSALGALLVPGVGINARKLTAVKAWTRFNASSLTVLY